MPYPRRLVGRLAMAGFLGLALAVAAAGCGGGLRRREGRAPADTNRMGDPASSAHHDRAPGVLAGVRWGHDPCGAR